MGINIQDMDDVEEIIIRTPDKEYVFDADVAVTLMVAQGQKTYQIVGNPTVRDRTEAPDSSPAVASESVSEADEEDSEVSIPQGDIDLVCEQTGASEEDARAALEASGGNPAEAILKLLDK
jgi:nascent polypeptide-associated complex subunit alpha